MTKNLIYLCKNKLHGIDRMLTILLELKLKILYPETNLIIVFRSDKHLNEVKENYNIWDGIKSMNPQICVIRGRNKLITSIRLIKFVSRLFFKDNIIVKDTDGLPAHKAVMKILRKLSSVKEIRTCLAVQIPFYFKRIVIERMLKRERDGNKVTSSSFLKGSYDYFLSALDSGQFKECFNVEVPDKKLIKVGYTYKLPEWEKFRKETVEKNKLINSGPYFFYILHTTYQRFSNFNEPDLIELVEESLNVLKKYSGKIKTIFKPHSITDMGKLKEILNKVNYPNYVIDYSHPMVLASKAKFVFGNVFSSIMSMAYYLGTPTVEYCCYDPELFTRIGKQSLGGRFCDFFIYRDKKKLDEALNKLINDEVKVERDPDFMRSSFPDTPREFYEFWHKLLT